MSHPQGKYLGGVRTIEDLMGRCRVDEITGCWHWACGRDGGGQPTLWLPALRQTVSLGVAICMLRTGKRPMRGVAWHCTCETRHCANPAHRKPGNRSTQMLAANLQRDAVTRSRMAAARRRKSKLSDEAVAEIRASTEFLRVVAERHGISMSHASNIRRGKQRLQLGARAASVFNLGSAA
jgi:hypothetical protein